jgi:transcription elongation factor Elf1
MKLFRLSHRYSATLAQVGNILAPAWRNLLVYRLLKFGRMIGNSGELKGATKSSTDVFFTCEHCGVSLVVDRAAAGATLTCEGCGNSTTVPKKPGDSARPGQSEASEKLAELRRHLKENESQRTEVKGYINQLSIQLHRWQLRLQALDERNIQLNGEMGVLTAQS